TCLVGPALARRGLVGVALELLGLAQADPALPAQHQAEDEGDQEYRHDDRDENPQGLRGHPSTLSRVLREGGPRPATTPRPRACPTHAAPTPRPRACPTHSAPAPGR